MKIVVMIKAGPYQYQAADTAWHFIQAAIVEGHSIPCVFFYQDGVYNANRLSVPPTDDRHIVRRWSELAKKQQIPLLLCTQSAMYRGITDTNVKKKYGLDGENRTAGFELAGLAQFVDYSITADRVITFSA